jgi:erythritol kinase (D-erythritol 1-phosphate-forming)
MTVIVGVDAGTSVTKAVAFDADGRALARADRPSRLDHLPGGRVEQNLENVLDTVCGVLREVCAALPRPPDAVALTGQGDGLWLRDAFGLAVRPAISWMDGRAAGLVAEWRDKGVVREVYRRTGSGMFPGCHAPLLAWLAAHEPETLARAAVAGYCVDAVAQRLTGDGRPDASDASLPFLDVVRRVYDPGAMSACGVGSLAGLLLEPQPPDTVLALNAEGARLTGLPVGTPVTSGPYDLPACAIGSGVLEVGDGLLIVGTTLACQVMTDTAVIDPGSDPAGMWLCTPDRGRWLRGMPAMVGTAALEWVLALVGAGTAELDELLDASPPGANGVTALPFLSEAGERAPFVEPGARGRLDGLSLARTRADVVRAMCEAIAYAARHCFEAAGLTARLAACGGGVRSGPWAQLFADVIGRPVHVPAEPEVGALGASYVARRALGGSAPAAPPSRRVEPRPALRARYDDGYTAYLDRLGRARSEWG